MIPHVSRLLELWRIAAHYRLDTLFPADELPVKAKHALNIIKMHPAAWSSRERKNPLKLKEALEDMGPLAIKLGQLLSTRRDLIPPEILAQLVLLQDQVKPFDGEVAKQRIQDSLKADVNTLFAALMINHLQQPQLHKSIQRRYMMDVKLLLKLLVQTFVAKFYKTLKFWLG